MMTPGWDFRTWRGFLDMGPDPLSRPLPRPIVFADRDDGTLYLLTHDSETETPVLETPVPARIRARPEEPLLRAPRDLLRLYVEAGSLRYEEVAEAERGLGTSLGVQGEGVFTFPLSGERMTLEIHAASYVDFGDPLCLTKISGLGRLVEREELGCDLFLVFQDDGVFEDNVFEEGVFV